MKIEISQDTYNKLKDQIIEEENKIKEKQEKKIEIKNRWTGSVIYTSSRTTFRDAVIEAVLRDANLSDADLSDANLRDADLRDANLRDANLSDANLRDANLSNADLRDANLSDANLRDANLRDANLSNAELYNAKFYGKGGTKELKKSQLPSFLQALGFKIID